MSSDDIDRIADGLHVLREGGMGWLLEVWLDQLGECSHLLVQEFRERTRFGDG